MSSSLRSAETGKDDRGSAGGVEKALAESPLNLNKLLKTAARR